MLLITLSFVGCSSDAAETGKGVEDTGAAATDSGSTTDPYAGPAGCISVDGAGDYPDIATAMGLANEGATIAVCAGTYAVSLVVDKAVTLDGQGAILEAPTNEPAIEVSAAATIRGFTLHSSRSGVVVTGDGATLQDLLIEAPANWGVESVGATGLTIEDITVTDAAFGGLNVNGGDTTVRTSSFIDVESYGIFATDATLTASGNTFTNVMALGDTDGVAILGTDTHVVSSGNTIETAVVGIVTEGGSLSSSADRIESVMYGISAYDGAITIADHTLADVYAQGIWAVAPSDEVSVTNTSVITDYETSYDNPYADFWDNNLAGGGLVLAGTTITASGLTISGFRTFGAFIGTPTGDQVTATLDQVSIVGVGRYGLYISGADTTVTNSSISFLVEPEYGAPCRDDIYATSWYPYVSAAIFNVGAALNVSGTRFQSNQGWGIANYEGQATVSGSEFAANDCSAIMNFYGTLALSSSTMTGSGHPGAVWDYYGVSSVSETTFSANTGGYIYAYESSGTNYTTEYDGEGIALYGQGSSQVDVRDSAFENGDYGVYLISTAGTVSGNRFTGMNRASIYAVASDSSVEVSAADNDFEDVGDSVIALQGVAATLTDNTVGTQRMTTVNYSYAAEGVEYSSSVSIYSGDVLYGYDIDLDLGGLSFGAAPSDAIYLVDSTATLDNVVGTSTVGELLIGYWSENTPDLEASGLHVEESGSYGVLLESDALDGGYTSIRDSSIGNAAYNGLSLNNLGEVVIEGVSVTTAGYYGLYADTITDLTLTDVSIGAAGYDGISIDSSSAVLTGVSATASGDNGLQLEDSTVDVQENSFTGNSTYGMRCTTVTLVACMENDLSGNGVGEHSGCDDACGAPAAAE